MANLLSSPDSCTIRFCSFKKNHTEKNYLNKTIPVYQVGATNYHINFEDSYSKDLEIYNCRFYRSSTSIGRLLFGVYSMSFHDNESDAGVVIYNNILSEVYNNSFKSAGFGIADWRHSSNDNVLKQYGFHYRTRVFYFHDNCYTQEASYNNHYRTLIYQYDNTCM